MKRLSDYKGDDALELWGDLLIPITNIITDKEVQKVYKSGVSKIEIASEILKMHKTDATKILLRIDPTPLDGLNTIVRVVDIIVDIEKSEETKSFFGHAEQAQQAQT